MAWNRMAWNRKYRLLSNVKSSLWVVPVVVLVVEVALKRVSEQFGGWMVRQGLYDLKTGWFALNADGAQATLDRIFTVALSCLVFTFGSLLVAIQVASGQYTPRIIATTLLRDKVIRWVVGLFVFTLLWAHRTMTQLGMAPEVPQFQVFLAVLLAVACIIAFLILIDYSAKLLRPVSLVRRISEQGIAVIADVYPDLTKDLPVPMHSKPERKLKEELPPSESLGISIRPAAAEKRGPPDRVIYHKDRSGIVLAVNLKALVAEAQRTDCIIEFTAQVGDFVSVDEPLFYLYGDEGAIDDRRLRELVALGAERTMEQDPMFSFRIVVDIALKALSPAINDPTTAVLAIDQLQRLLRAVGRRSLRDREILDNKGQVRLVFRTPNWEDFVHMAFREIRCCGANSIQVARRLRSMIGNLMETLPAHRHPALQEELELLDSAIAAQHMFKEDQELARIPDSQGLGGASSAN